MANVSKKIRKTISARAQPPVVAAIQANQSGQSKYRPRYDDRVGV